MARPKVVWFRHWHPDLDAALEELPELEMCPRDLYRELLLTSGPHEKRIALVTEGEKPLAVVGLRRRTRFTWEPACQWLVPGPTFPARPGAFFPALGALNLSIPIGWWRMAEPLPPASCIRHLEAEPSYCMLRLADREAFWRKSRYMATIKNVRNRCASFTWAVDRPGVARWVIANWSARWNQGRGDPTVADRMLIAATLEPLGRHHSIGLFDGDRLIAGSTNLVHQGDLVASVLHCDPDYRNKGVGIRTIDLTFSFAAEKGFIAFDMGRGYGYKSKWAPEGAPLVSCVVGPSALWWAQRMASRLRRALTWPLPGRAREMPGNCGGG